MKISCTTRILIAPVTALLLLTYATLAAAEDETIASGSFEGASGHVTTGTVTIKHAPDGLVAVLESDFAFDGAPDPKLGFGKDGYDASSTFSPLKADNGTQTYLIPESIDISVYNEFYIWCEQYSVPLGIARLKR